MSSLESVWEYREEVLYPTLFGHEKRGIFVLDGQLFTNVFRQETYDPRWLHLGIFEFQPTPRRTSWLYVSSGGSTPWETDPSEYDPNGYSWLGTEFVIEVPIQSPWALVVLQRLLAYHVLLCHGRYGDVSPLDYGHRVPVGGPIDPKSNSPLQYVAIAEPKHYPSTAQLDSGKFDFLHVVGITKAEREYAIANSTSKLISVLEAQSAFPVTNPLRESVVL